MDLLNQLNELIKLILKNKEARAIKPEERRPYLEHIKDCIQRANNESDPEEIALVALFYGCVPVGNSYLLINIQRMAIASDNMYNTTMRGLRQHDITVNERLTETLRYCGKKYDDIELRSWRVYNIPEGKTIQDITAPQFIFKWHK